MKSPPARSSVRTKPKLAAQPAKPVPALSFLVQSLLVQSLPVPSPASVQLLSLILLLALPLDQAGESAWPPRRAAPVVTPRLNPVMKPLQPARATSLLTSVKILEPRLPVVVPTSLAIFARAVLLPADPLLLPARSPRNPSQVLVADGYLAGRRTSSSRDKNLLFLV